MNRTKRLAKEKAAKAADLRRQLAELEDPEDSPADSDVDPDPSSKDMGAFVAAAVSFTFMYHDCLLYTSPSPRDRQKSRMPSSA